jgi:hypothetical protein
MITGAHFLLYSKDPEADRAFFREILEFRAVDLGHGWLIFGLPPAELAVHPSDANFVQKHADHDLLGAILYLMCDDLLAMVKSLEAKNVRCAPITEARWGMSTSIALPSGGEIGLYQPTHLTAIDSQS